MNCCRPALLQQQLVGGRPWAYIIITDGWGPPKTRGSTTCSSFSSWRTLLRCGIGIAIHKMVSSTPRTLATTIPRFLPISLQLILDIWKLWFATGDHKIVQGSRRRELLTGLLSNRPLAVRSDRIDPLNHFRHYRGGFDVNNKHYWAVCTSNVFSITKLKSSASI